MHVHNHSITTPIPITTSNDTPTPLTRTNISLQSLIVYGCLRQFNKRSMPHSVISLQKLSALIAICMGCRTLGALGRAFPCALTIQAFVQATTGLIHQPPGRGQITKIVLMQSTTRIANRLGSHPIAKHYGLSGVFKNRLMAIVFDIQY